MVSVVNGPWWFVTPAVGIELVSSIILGVIAIAVMRYYVFSKRRVWLRLGASFALLSSAELGHAVLTWGLMAKTYVLNGGVIVLAISPHLIRSVLLFIGVFVLECLMLYGLYLLFTTYHDTSKTQHAIVAFLLFFLLFFTTESYFVFHLIALVFLLLVSIELFVRRKKKKLSSKLLPWAFAFLASSRLAYLLVPLSPLLFVLGSIIQVLGLLALAYEYLQTIRHAKKISTGHH